MIQIFQPLLANALIYIDDILLYSPIEASHAQLLTEFHSIIQQYGVILSKKKMVIAQTSVDFLRRTIFDGKYQLQPYISQEILKFPNELTLVKQVQQFLCLVNYMADFIPKFSTYTAPLSNLL